MKSFIKIACLALVFTFILSGCNRSADKDILGAWQMVYEQENGPFLEFTEERLIVRIDPDDVPETMDYRFTDLQKGKFIIEIAESGSTVYEFFLEGRFEKKNLIKVTKADVLDAGETFELMRVKDIEKEREKQKEAKAKEELERKAAVEKAAKEEQEEAEKEAEEENAESEETDVEDEVVDAPVEQPVEQTTEENKDNEAATENNHITYNSTRTQYLNEANLLENNILAEMSQFSPHDIDPIFYGQYFESWDGLLNEIWGVLKGSLPANEFEQLKSEQITWIKEKEQRFNSRPADTAAERGESYGYLTLDTRDRVFYLIDYLQ